MKKGIIKFTVLICVFFIGVQVFGQLTNHTNEDLTTEMADATLPIVSFYISDETGRQEINELRGYTAQMQPVYMRDTITTVSKDRLLPLKIQTYDTRVDEISYEIRSLDAQRLIADSKVENYEEEKGKITAEITIQNLLEENEEYLFIFKLKSRNDTIYYYTRIMEESNCFPKKCVDFSMYFHEKTFNKDQASELATYLEPNASGDNSTLHKVDIHSSLNQVSWADFEGERLTTPVPSLKEANDSFSVVVLYYLMDSIGINGEMEYYNVEEYYRIRHTSDRMYLLSYERTMNQIFRAESSSFYDNYIQLGIRNSEIEYAANEKGNIVCFVQEGELWCYNQTGNQLSQVFSFIGNEGIDKRENYGEHDIKIISIDETGSVNFIVYGYMNCGSHEGKTGICVYHYDSVANTIEEELFIPATTSYQVMRADLGQLMYENSQGIFFIMLGGTVYRIDLSTMKTSEHITGLLEGAYAISDSHKYFAWSEGDNQNASDLIWLTDLDRGSKKEIRAGEDEYLKPLGFMGEDFVYGVAGKDDVLTDLAGNITFPMYKICIVDSSTMEPLKEYEKPEYFVSDIAIVDYIMYLNRVQFNGMAYVEASQDTIMNREGDSTTLVAPHSTVTEVKQTQIQLSMAEMVKEASPKILTPKEIVFDNNREIALESEEKKNSYYAYARGDVLAVTDDLKSAIATANQEMGVVIGDRQQYVWKRDKKSVRNPLELSAGAEDGEGNSIARCVSAMLERESIHIGVTALISQGKTPKEILETAMENVTALDLTGCRLEEVLYYVSLGNPVFAMRSDVDAVLVSGYDAQNVFLYNPLTSSSEKMGMNDATKLFENAGNVFFGYIK